MVASVPLNHQIVTVDWIRGLVAVSVKREGLSWESRGKPRSATPIGGVGAAPVDYPPCLPTYT